MLVGLSSITQNGSATPHNQPAKEASAVGTRRGAEWSATASEFFWTVNGSSSGYCRSSTPSLAEVEGVARLAPARLLRTGRITLCPGSSAQKCGSECSFFVRTRGPSLRPDLHRGGACPRSRLAVGARRRRRVKRLPAPSSHSGAFLLSAPALIRGKIRTTFPNQCAARACRCQGGTQKGGAAARGMMRPQPGHTSARSRRHVIECIAKKMLVTACRGLPAAPRGSPQ